MSICKNFNVKLWATRPLNWEGSEVLFGILWFGKPGGFTAVKTCNRRAEK